MKKQAVFKWVKRIIALVVILAIVVGVIFFVKGRKTEETVEEIQTAIVARRSIVNTVTGSGTVEAYETYNIVPKITGDIIYCTAEEGDWVEEDDVLYRFDSERSDNAIEKAENAVESAEISLNTAEENVEKLTVTASSQGVVSNLNLLLGENANGTICTLTDNTYMIAPIPVAVGVIENIKTGDKVSVSLEKYMITVTGTVDRITSASFAGENGAMVKTVDVKITNPGSIEEGTMAFATFHTPSGDIEGAAAAALNYPASTKVNARQSGEIVELNIKNGDWVNKGDVIAVLENSQLENALRNAKMSYDNAVSSLEDTKKEAENYYVTSPIAGKVMEKNYKKGDTVAGNNSTTLMVVADTTKMKFTINVDELDVAKISVGQEVQIEADAIEGEIFTGIIETVSLLGTSSQGVTYYPVIVRIDQPGNLLPGMNVSAEIIAERADNVIAVPSGAVSFYGGKYYVTVVGEAEMGKMPQRGEFAAGDKPPFENATMPNRESFGEGMTMPPRESFGEGAPQRGNAMPMGSAEGGKFRGGERENAQINQTMYEEEMRVEVTTGVSDDDYIEIVSGLKEGQVVKVTGSSNQNSGWGNFGGMPMGGGMRGGMPMGGMR